ncbi:MAG: hypothetical protein VW879_06555, partial [Opitutae bacterium]
MRLRRATKSQGDRKIIVKQTSFEGENSDFPERTLLTPGESAKPRQFPELTNAFCRGKYVEPESGSELFTKAKIPSGTYHRSYYHQSAKRWIVHIGTGLYTSGISMSNWIPVFDQDTNTALALPDEDSSIQAFGDDAIAFTGSGHFYVNLMKDGFAGQSDGWLMFESPYNRVISSGSGDYTYRYFITFLRLVESATPYNEITSGDRYQSGARLVCESGSTVITKTVDSFDYGEISQSNPIGIDNPITINRNQQESGITTVASNEITVTKRYHTGQAISFSTGTLPTEIAANTTYYVVAISSTKIKLATTQDNAYDGTTMSITAGGSYVMTLNCDLAKLAGNAVTHIGIYRSLNFNGNTSDGFDPETSQGNSKEIAAWVGDIPVG